MIFCVISLPILLRSASAAEPFYHSSKSGYDLQWKEYGPCPPEKRGTNEIFTDVHLTKRRQGVAEIVGKTILRVPFDDNVTGVYELKGYDVNNLIQRNVLPKEFFFGRYKITIEYFRFRKLVGCAYTIVQIVPALQRRSKKNEH